MNMHAMNTWLTDAVNGGWGGGLDFAPMVSQLKKCWGGTAGQARHNSSNVGVSLQARWYTTLVGTLQVEDRCQRPTNLRRINR